MRDDAPEQPGPRRTADAHAVRVGLAMVIVMIVLEGSARAQLCAADTDEQEILLHPGAPTILHLPDEIVDARLLHRGEFLFEIVGHDVNLRPRPGTHAGTWGRVTVETRTLYRTFRLRVVACVEDAQREVLVSPEKPSNARNQPGDQAPPVVPAATEPAASATSSTPAPSATSSAPAALAAPESAVAAAPQSMAAPESTVTTAPQSAAEPGNATAAVALDAAADGERDAAASSPRFVLSVHAVAALAGTTELTMAGYEAIDARQSHRAFGGRLAVAPPGAWWAVEANLGWEGLAAPTTHDNAVKRILVHGPWVRADLGLRGRLPTRLSPTAYGGAGFQAQYRDIENVNEDDPPASTLPRIGVLVLGLGLEYRAGNLLLGLELHLRHGMPTDYFSMSGLLSVGWVLEQEE